MPHYARLQAVAATGARGQPRWSQQFLDAPIKYAAENGCGYAECAAVKEYVRGPPPKLQSKKKEGKNKAATCATATCATATGDAATGDAATGAASP